MKLRATAWLVIAVLLSSINVSAQIKNEKSLTVKINGNCGMCKSTIEKAGNNKNLAQVDWDKDTKIATLKYNSEQTNPEEILKRIALAGYDNELFLAPEAAYDKLDPCCQYERELKAATIPAEELKSQGGHDNTHQHTDMATKAVSPFAGLFNTYFLIKDALVKANIEISSTQAAQLLKATHAIDKSTLSGEEQQLWTPLMKGITENAQQIASHKNIAKQREAFAKLSQDFYALTKVYTLAVPLYYMHCPMYDGGKGANWLSKEAQVSNPYYGSQMLHCGAVAETLGSK